MNFYMRVNNGSNPITLPSRVKPGDAITAKLFNSMIYALERLRDRVPVITGNGKIETNTKPPLWVTLYLAVPTPATWKVYVEYGQVVPRHNTSADTGTPIEITALPTKAAPLTVTAGTKLWVKETISDVGKVTAAVFESGSAYPDDTPPQLKGGDNTSGTTGYRHIRIAEIVSDPESTSTPAPLICNQLLTGHIDHFQNELVENVDTTGSNILKKFDLATGAFLLRTLTAGAGITITENADSVEVAADGASSGAIWGTFRWYLDTSLELELTFENGILTAADGATIGGAGTEADPYEINFVAPA